MIAGCQIRAARALLRWSAHMLAQSSGVSWTTIQRIESTDGVPSATARNIDKIQRTLESAGNPFYLLTALIKTVLRMSPDFAVLLRFSVLRASSRREKTPEQVLVLFGEFGEYLVFGYAFEEIFANR